MTYKETLVTVLHEEGLYRHKLNPVIRRSNGGIWSFTQEWLQELKLKLFRKLLQKLYPSISHNQLQNDGEQAILESFFRNNYTPAFYFGLGNNGGTPGVPSVSTGLAGITEVSGTGYARIAVTRDTVGWGATTLVSGRYQTTSATYTFTAGGTWTAADYGFICDVSSGTAGKLLVTAALSASRTLINGDKLDVSHLIALV